MIVDGMILTERWKVAYGDEWYEKKASEEKTRVHPASIAKASRFKFQPAREMYGLCG